MGQMIALLTRFVQCYNRRVPEDGAHVLSFISDSPATTHQFGERLGRLIRPGDLIGLSGELGAGKTTLAAGIGRGWGAREAVHSPTFILVNTYSREDGLCLYHVDAYRLRDPLDAESIGLWDLLSDERGAVLVEWPERLGEALPAERLKVELRWLGDLERHVRLEANGARYEAMAAQLA
jgi:tRNA threonylcarbamoyladenosine biosynthesis protein TsaE